ncbi:response regulator transcription factor [Bosea sp. (in: a-proteobacteria)]|uniref:response regulator transcription factor n=1 Tax=Bosea sp. (in: a-proteobacteria) TaxID=1871050 RepID=UPI00261C4F2C|nr:response regulator [Bosea sp. (in: a-proteobacteria)]MCO5092722.1 response regulator [Bosea sp. (in: a-proteobacteria)]
MGQDIMTAEPATRRHILIADDDPMSRDMLSRRLARQGFAVTTAETGKSALSLLETGRFHAVLLDGMMPEMPGLDVLRHLRGAANQTRVIMVTGKALSNDIEEAMALGADGYVTKPVDFRKLMALIEDEKQG